MRGRCREGGRGEGNKKRGRELLEKRRGTIASLYLVKDRAGKMKSSDTIPDAAGGEGGHEVARPDGVIHRYITSLNTIAMSEVTSTSPSP
jgi:hypothetical protein